jgi:uncharacterized protein DUF417
MPQHGFPYLSGAGRLVIKDTVILAGALLVIVDTVSGAAPSPCSGDPSDAGGDLARSLRNVPR